MWKVMLAGGLLALCASAQAQTMYKCKNADGTMAFTQQPCSDSAEAIELKVVQPPTEQQMEASGRLASQAPARDEQACIRQAERAAYSAADARTRGHQRKISQLEAKIATRANNFAGATWEAGMREEIAALHQTISSERTSADAIASAGRQRCAEDRRRAEDAAMEAEGQGG